MAKKRQKKNKLWQRTYVLAAIAIIMIGVQVANTISGGQLAHTWGLWPRHINGLPGVICSPWLHSSWTHLWSNLPVLLIFCALTMWDSMTQFTKVSTFIILGGNFLVWIFGRDAIHVGASGWLFGLWAWLIMRAFFKRSLANIAIAIAILAFYGGLWWGLLPQKGISVEAHLAGAICGALAAWLYQRSK